MWLQLGNIVLGIWLLLAPSLLPSTGPGAGIDRAIGPVVIWLGVLALRSVTRPSRAMNVLCGVALAVAPWLVANTDALLWGSVLAGWAIVLLSIPRGQVPQRTAGGWWAIIHPELTSHAGDN